MPTDFDPVAEIARRMKQDLVQEFGNHSDEGAADIRSFVVVLRDGRQIAMIEVGSGPDGTRNAVHMGALFFRAHEMFLVADARMRTYKKEEDLRKVQKGDYERSWKTGQREGIIECLIVSYFPMLGDPQMIVYPYERDGKQLRWREPIQGSMDMQGAVLDYAKAGYRECREKWPQVKQALDAMADSLGVGPGEQEYRTDRAVAAYVTKETDVTVSLFEAGVMFEDGKEEVLAHD